MCSQYSIEMSLKDIIALLNVKRDDVLLEELPAKVLPYIKAPALYLEDGVRVLDAMQFSLIPRWSAEPRSKFATHNARLDTIDEKNTFKEAFVKHHCIVPMTGFIEPIYVGSFAGNMLEFHPPAPVLLYAAGIWDEWVDKKSGEVIKSFSIITHEPIPFVLENGHDRSPVFLKPEDADRWLRSEGEAPPALKEFLLDVRYEPELRPEISRPMKSGWEKRKPKSLSD